MSEEKKKLGAKLEELDFDKICGRYIHFGHLVLDLRETGQQAVENFYYELYKIHEGMLADCVDDKELFDLIQKEIITNMNIVITMISEAKLETVKEKLNEMLESHNKNWNEVKKQFGKTRQNYFS